MPNSDILFAKVREKILRAGIHNFTLDAGGLIMCGTRYKISNCACGDPECDGVKLERALVANGPAAAVQ